MSCIDKTDFKSTECNPNPDNVNAPRRCEFELWVEEFYGLPPNIKEDAVISTNYLELVNLLATYSEYKKDHPCQPVE